MLLLPPRSTLFPYTTLFRSSRLAGNACPSAVLIQPDVRKAPPPGKRLAFLNAFVPVDAGADCHTVAVQVDGHALVVDLLSGNVSALHACQKLLLRADGSVVIDINEILGQQVCERVAVFVLLSLIPRRLERNDSSLFPAGFCRLLRLPKNRAHAKQGKHGSNRLHRRTSSSRFRT